MLRSRNLIPRSWGSVISRLHTLIVVCLALGATSVSQTTDAIKRLPSPNGKYGVARVSYDWIDKSRIETLSNDAGAHRELMVFVWYPTVHVLVKKPAKYLPNAKLIAETIGGEGMKDFWDDASARVVSGKIQSDTAEASRIATGKEQFPLIVFMPGLGVPTTAYTTLVEEVVSHGYVVASVEPTYEVPVAFADGRVVPFSDAAAGRKQPAPPGETRDQFLARMHAFDAPHLDRWAGDMRFVVDQVTMLNAGKNAAPFSARVDLSNIAAWGHSFGGRAAPRACQLDSRFKACMNADGLATDGPIFRYAGATLPSQPFMWMEVFHEPPSDQQLAQFHVTRKDWDKNHQTQIDTDEQELKECAGGSYHVSINLPGIDHLSFTDKPLIEAETKEDTDQALNALSAIEKYTLAFFDLYLRQENDHLLDQPAKQGATVAVERFPTAKK
jgi:hypothetical protein